MEVTGEGKLNQTVNIPVLDTGVYWQSSNTLSLGK